MPPDDLFSFRKQFYGSPAEAHTHTHTNTQMEKKNANFLFHLRINFSFRQGYGECTQVERAGDLVFSLLFFVNFFKKQQEAFWPNHLIKKKKNENAKTFSQIFSIWFGSIMCVPWLHRQDAYLFYHAYEFTHTHTHALNRTFSFAFSLTAFPGILQLLLLLRLLEECWDKFYMHRNFQCK